MSLNSTQILENMTMKLSVLDSLALTKRETEMKEMKRYSAFIQMKRITNKMTHIIFRSIPKAKFCILGSMNSFITKHIKIQRHTTD